MGIDKTDFFELFTLICGFALVNFKLKINMK